MTTLNYIIYQCEGEGPREIVIVDGIPYYCSTGCNSTVPNVWFPFIVLNGKFVFPNGDRPYNIDGLPSYLSKEKLKHIFYQYEPTYIVKLDADYFIEKPQLFRGIDPDTDGFAWRLPTKETLITSMRLSGEHFPQDKLALVNISPEEKRLTTKPLILDKKPIFTTSDPDRVNQWLFKEGATLARALISEDVNQWLVKIAGAHLSKKRMTSDDTILNSSQSKPKTTTIEATPPALSFFKEEPPANPNKRNKARSLST